MNRVVVAKVAHQKHGLVLAALLLGDVDERRHGHLHNFSVVGLDGDVLVVIRSGRAVEKNDRDVGRVSGSDGWDGGVVVGRDEYDSVDLAFDHRLHLIVLLVLVPVGDRLERRPAVFLCFRLQDVVAGDPEIRVEGVEHERDRLAPFGSR